MSDRRSEANERTAYSESMELVKALRSIGYSFPHFISHHPHCRWYEEDVLHIGKWRLCWGCIVAYPVALLTLIILMVTGAHDLVQWYILLVLGFAFGSFELISLWRKGRGFRHHLIKIFLGVGLAFATTGVFIIPVHIVIRIVVFFQLLLIAGALASLRILQMERKCKRCSWKGNWMRCPGFEEMNSKLEKEGLLIRR
jgi:hypothetical protein